MVLTRLVSDLGTVCCLGRGLLFLTGLSLAMDSMRLVWRGLADCRRMRDVKEKRKRKNKNSSSARVKKQRIYSNNDNQWIKMEQGMIKDFNHDDSNFIANILEDILSKSMSNEERKRDEVEDEVNNIADLSTDFHIQLKIFCYTRSWGNVVQF